MSETVGPSWKEGLLGRCKDRVKEYICEMEGVSRRGNHLGDGRIVKEYVCEMEGSGKREKNCLRWKDRVIGVCEMKGYSRRRNLLT